MVYFGNLNEKEIARAEEARKQIVSELEEDYSNVLRAHDRLAREGNIPGEGSARRKALKLRKEMDYVENLPLPQLSKEYSHVVKKIQSDLPEDFKIENSRIGRIMMLFFFLFGIYVNAAYEIKTLTYYLITVVIIAVSVEAIFKGPPRLQAMPAKA